MQLSTRVVSPKHFLAALFVSHFFPALHRHLQVIKCRTCLYTVPKISSAPICHITDFLVARNSSIGPASVRAAERAMERGKHCKIRPPNKEDAFPMGVSRSMWELDRAVAVYRVQRPMPCVRSDGNQRAEFFSSHPCRSPRTSARSSLRIGPARVSCCRACDGAREAVQNSAPR